MKQSQNYIFKFTYIQWNAEQGQNCLNVELARIRVELASTSRARGRYTVVGKRMYYHYRAVPARVVLYTAALVDCAA